jgi:hypothetical protein
MCSAVSLRKWWNKRGVSGLLSFFRKVGATKHSGIAYGRTSTLALALPPRLLFTVMLPGLLVTLKLPLPLDGKVPIKVLVAVL